MLTEIVLITPQRQWANIYHVNKCFSEIVNLVVSQSVKALTTKQAFLTACEKGNYLAIVSFARVEKNGIFCAGKMMA